VQANYFSNGDAALYSGVDTLVYYYDNMTQRLVTYDLPTWLSFDVS